jgi:hypothetical protein
MAVTRCAKFVGEDRSELLRVERMLRTFAATEVIEPPLERERLGGAAGRMLTY